MWELRHAARLVYTVYAVQKESMVGSVVLLVEKGERW